MRQVGSLLFVLVFLAGCSLSPVADPTPAPTLTQTATPAPTNTPFPSATNTVTPAPSATATTTPSAGAVDYQVTIVLDPSLFGGDVSVAAAWLGYASARAEWIQTHVSSEQMAQMGYRRAFEEEVAARSSLAKIWKELQANQGGAKNAYLDDLLKVYEAGFIREYTWNYLAIDEWIQPDELRLEEFTTWARVNIPNHAPERLADVQISINE